MKIEDILLWTFSLVLAVAGIIFGIIASWNSTKANRKIEQLISEKWIHDESKKLFFENIQEIIVANKEALLALNKKEITYFKYSRLSTKTRMIPQTAKFLNKVESTEFAEVSTIYQSSRTSLDKKFRDIFTDLTILHNESSLDDEHRKSLIDYHKQVVEVASKIMKHYSHIVEG